jgi:hypothetical protein
LSVVVAGNVNVPNFAEPVNKRGKVQTSSVTGKMHCRCRGDKANSTSTQSGMSHTPLGTTTRLELDRTVQLDSRIWGLGFS